MKKLITFLFLLFFFQNSYCQITNTKIVSKLVVETIEDISIITPRITNKTDLFYSLRYDLSVVRFDSVNKPIKESKEDFFVLDPYQTKDFSQLSIDTNGDSKINVFILVYDDEDNLLAKDRIGFNEEEQQEQQEQSIEEDVEESRDGLVLLGLVADETKTKFGKDFYDYFYFYYSYNKVNGEKVVKVNEERSFGRTTKITISIEENIVMQFITRPNSEYLEEMAKNSVIEVFKYFLKLKQENSYITKY